jgi:hypothetical protein
MKFMVCYDGSEESKEALKTARHHAKIWGATQYAYARGTIKAFKNQDNGRQAGSGSERSSRWR